MPTPATHADSLRLTVSGTELQHLSAVGTLPGVVVLLAAARNGPGTGKLQSSDAGATLAWRAPGSSTFGPPVDCSTDGSYLLEDGQHADKWVRIQVYGDYLVGGAGEAEVFLQDRWGNNVADDDVTAGEASAGDTASYTITLENDSGVVLSDLRVWLDDSVWRVEISDDNATWVTPRNESDALSLPDLVAGGTDTLYLRRTIPLGVDAQADVLDHLHFAFDGV